MIITSAVVVKGIQLLISARIAYRVFTTVNNKLKNRTSQKEETKVVKG